MQLEEYEEKLRTLPCCACVKGEWTTTMLRYGEYEGSAVSFLHHPYGGSMSTRGVYKSSNSKVSDWLQLPICYNHHQGQEGIHRIGIREWEQVYGEQAFFVDNLSDLFRLDVWELAGEKKERKYKPPKKLLPRNNNA